MILHLFNQKFPMDFGVFSKKLESRVGFWVLGFCDSTTELIL